MPNGDKAQNTFIHIASSKEHQTYSLQCFDYLHSEASQLLCMLSTSFFKLQIHFGSAIFLFSFRKA